MNAVKSRGVFARRFVRAYLRSLRDHRFFYDDIAEIGNPVTARHVFYFVPGMNGTPGQMRFLLPSLTGVFGSSVYLKALHLSEFSARRPTWRKYTPGNLDRRLEQLRRDLADLLDRHERFAVLCSSNGFYDFAAAVQSFPAALAEARIQLVWGACAPDRYDATPWERVFYPLNGFEHEGHRWFAYPNHNALSVVNPETSSSHHWRDAEHPRRLYKVDLESRFRCAGLQWDYLSTSQLGTAARSVVHRIRRPWCGPAQALVATNDGYWQGRPRAAIEHTIRRYLPNAHIVYERTSHLWVVNPTHVTALLHRLRPAMLGRGGSPTERSVPPDAVPLGRTVADEPTATDFAINAG
jgi:hypothetical protein